MSLAISNSNDLHAYAQDGELDAADPVSPQLNITTKTSSFGIYPGYELHFDGTDNLSPYFAFEVPIVLGKRADTKDFWGAGDIDDDQVSLINLSFGTWQNEQGTTYVGLNLLFGADYYFSDAIYLGFEAGIGFGKTTFGNHSITTDNLTAFNMEFNNATFTEDAGAELMGEFVGELPFSALGENELDIYSEYFENAEDGSRSILLGAESHLQHHIGQHVPRCVACWFLV